MENKNAEGIEKREKGQKDIICSVCKGVIDAYWLIMTSAFNIFRKQTKGIVIIDIITYRKQLHLVTYNIHVPKCNLCETNHAT